MGETPTKSRPMTRRHIAALATVFGVGQAAAQIVPASGGGGGGGAAIQPKSGSSPIKISAFPAASLPMGWATP